MTAIAEWVIRVSLVFAAGSCVLNAVTAVRVRHEDVREEIGVLLEEFRVVLEVLGDGVRIHVNDLDESPSILTGRCGAVGQAVG